MTQAKMGDDVKVNYTGKLEDGTVFDTSSDREPLQFKIGEGDILPGFEEAVIGMTEGDSKTITIASQDAYGPYHKELILHVDRSEFPEEINPELGQQFRIPLEEERTVLVMVIGITEDQVTLDANHPLAGRDLTFDIELIEIV